jgi:hypothetical protein
MAINLATTIYGTAIHHPEILTIAAESGVITMCLESK